MSRLPLGWQLAGHAKNGSKKLKAQRNNERKAPLLSKEGEISALLKEGWLHVATSGAPNI